MQQFKLVKGNPEKLKGSVIAYSKYIGKYQKSDLELAASQPIQNLFTQNIQEGAVFAKWGSINEQEFTKKIAQNKIKVLQKTFYETTKQIQMAYAALGVKTRSPQNSVVTTFQVKKQSSIFNYVEDVIFAGHYSDIALCDSILDTALSWYLAQCEESRYAKTKRKAEEPFHEVFNGKDLEDYINYAYVEPMKEHLQKAEQQEYGKLRYDFIWSTINTQLENCPTFIQLCNHLENNKGNITGKYQTSFVKEMAAVLDQRWLDAASYHKQRKA